VAVWAPGPDGRGVGPASATRRLGGRWIRGARWPQSVRWILSARPPQRPSRARRPSATAEPAPASGELVERLLERRSRVIGPQLVAEHEL